MPSKNPRDKEQPENAWPLQDIQNLISLLADKQISEFELEKEGLKVRIKLAAPPGVPGARLAQAAPIPLVFEPVVPSSPGAFAPTVSAGAAAASPTPTTEARPASVSSGEPQSSEGAEDLHIIKSPIVGTFYGSPSPNAPPFARVGDQVSVGQVLCIIEAMKLMNEIESEVEGEVVRVYVESGQPVEYGESLFALRPSHKKSG